MAEALGAVSAVVGLVEFSGQLLSYGYFYLSKVVKAPAQIRNLLNEVSAVNSILAQLQDQVESPGPTSEKGGEVGNAKPKTALDTLHQLGVFETCGKLLKNVEKAIKACEQMPGQNVKNFGKKLIWPLKERETTEMMARLRALRETLAAAVTVDSKAAIDELQRLAKLLHTEISQVKAHTAAQFDARKRAQIYELLCSEATDPSENYNLALRTRQPETGRWFLKHDSFDLWRRGLEGLLWVRGIPGCGKTVLSATVIEHLAQWTAQGDSTVAYFYFDHNDASKRTLRQALATISSQLMRTSARCLADGDSLLKTKKDDAAQRVTNTEYLELLVSMSEHFETAFVVIDALDECADPTEFTQGLQHLMSRASSRFSFLVTSRGNITMDNLLGPPTSTFTIQLNELVQLDIESFVTDAINTRLSAKTFMQRDPKLCSKIIRTIVDKSHGLFLQAKLQVDLICKLKTLRAIKATLEHMPSGLDALYDKILRDISTANDDNIQLVIRSLQWLECSAENMALEALAQAVAVELEDITFDWENMPDAKDLAEMLSSLVAVYNEAGVDRIRLAHLSVTEYLCSGRLLQTDLSKFHVDPVTTHVQLATACARFISFEDFQDAPAKYRPKTQSEPLSDHAKTKPTALKLSLDNTFNVGALIREYPFFDYAKSHWLYHIHESRITQDNFDILMAPHMEWFLAGTSGVYDSYWLIQQRIPNLAYMSAQSYHLVQHFRPDKHVHPILCSTSAGVEQVTSALLGRLPDIDAILHNDLTALTIAAYLDQLQIVSLVLRKGANPNVPSGDSKRKKTAIHFAAERGNVAMINMLLDHGADVDYPSSTLATPLYRAARAGWDNIVKILRDRGADVNARTYDNWTPLLEAVQADNVLVIELLLASGASPNIKNDTGETPFTFAKNHAPRLLPLIRAGAAAKGITIEGDDGPDTARGLPTIAGLSVKGRYRERGPSRD